MLTWGFRALRDRKNGQAMKTLSHLQFFRMDVLIMLPVSLLAFSSYLIVLNL